MAWKTLFCAFSNETLIQPTLSYAAELAAAHEAHLEVLCLGVNRLSPSFYFANVTAVALQETIDTCQAESVGLEKAVRAILANHTGIRWSCERGVAQLTDVGRAVAARARFADIALIPSPYGQGRTTEAEALAEFVLFESGASAMILPDECSYKGAAKTVTVGWNESPEALRAIRSNLEVLQRADRVHVVIVDPPEHGPNRSDPGGFLSQYLARHGVNVEIDVLSKTLPRISDVLIRHATDVGADLILMGAYGHSRLREAIFGGATRSMLENARLPVLMAH